MMAHTDYSSTHFLQPYSLSFLQTYFSLFSAFFAAFVSAFSTFLNVKHPNRLIRPALLCLSSSLSALRGHFRTVSIFDNLWPC